MKLLTLITFAMTALSISAQARLDDRKNSLGLRRSD